MQVNLVVSMKSSLKIVSLIQELTSLLSKSVENKVPVLNMTKDICPNPFKDLPNISALRLKTNKQDPLLAKHGVTKKLDPEFDFEVLSHRTKAANRYLRIMHGRLCNLLIANRKIEYWILALMLMQKSKVLRCVALRKLNHNWYREWKFGTVKSMMKNLDIMIKTMPYTLLVIRDYVSKVKPDGTKTWRPIGSPTYVVRMYLYLIQSFLVIFLNPVINKSQHAYRPGQGVVTALREVQNSLDKYKYVWEFDLKGAFPSVMIPKTCDALIDVGVPAPFAEYLKQMSLAVVERVDLSKRGQLLPEPKFDKQAELIKLLPDTWLNPPVPPNAHPDQPFFTHRLPDGTELRQAAGYDKVVRTYIIDMVSNPGSLTVKILDPWEALEKFADINPLSRMMHSALLERVNKLEKDYLGLKTDTTVLQGFPQGFGTSPVLFNFAFEMFALRDHFQKLDPSVKVISYADDFLVFSKVPLPTVMDLPDNGSGLKVNLEKSRPVILDGVPQVESFKYLGATAHFTPEGIIWEGTPRSGTHLVFDKDEMVSDFEFRDRELRKFIAKVEGAPRSPGAVVSDWGLNKAPSSLLPLEVIKGEAKVTPKLINSINSVMSKEYLDGIPDEVKVKVSAIADFSEGLSQRLKGASKWLRSRIAGLLVNRLHSGSWETLDQVPDMSQSRAEKSWLDLRSKSLSQEMQTKLSRYPDLSAFRGKKFDGDLSKWGAYLDSLQEALNLAKEVIRDEAKFVVTNSIYTGTSLATKDLLTHLKDPIKVKKGKLVYPKP